MIFVDINQNREDEARAVLEKIYPSDKVEEEMNALQSSVEAEKADLEALGSNIFQRVKQAVKNDVVRRGLYAGVTVQVVQQFVGINTVMYYSPTIVQLAGFASNKTALALSLITSGLNAVGSIISMMFVDRKGRRTLMIISLFGIITCLVALSIIFFQAAAHSPLVGRVESNSYGGNSTCSAYLREQHSSSWNCMDCLKATDCAFCTNSAGKVCFFFLFSTCSTNSILKAAELLSSNNLIYFSFHSVSTWSLPSFNRSCERYSESRMPCTSWDMVHQWMPDQIRSCGNFAAGSIHHSILTWDGDSAMDCELRDISIEVQRHWWRNCCSC